MTAYELIKQVEEEAIEWIEMSDDPYRVVSTVLANKVISLKSYIQYLERRLNHDTERSSPRK